MPPWVGSFKATADDASSALTVLLLLADGSDFWIGRVRIPDKCLNIFRGMQTCGRAQQASRALSRFGQAGRETAELAVCQR